MLYLEKTEHKIYSLKNLLAELLIITVLLLFSSLTVFGQNTEKELEQEAIKALQDWFENPSFDTISNIDLSIMSQLQDSGRIVNGLREGAWIIYDIDSSQIGNMIDVTVNDKKHKMRLDPKIEKYVGKYQAEKKEGTWIVYESTNYKPPFWWLKKSQTDYKNGLKHGKEILYQGFGTDDLDTLGVLYYENGIETGVGRIYNVNYPYKLKEVYSSTQEGQAFLSEEYYDSGLLEIKYVDTLINNKFYFYFTEFYESGDIKSTGYYYKNNIDSTYREFHMNGQLFIEEDYCDGKLWNVKTIKNSKGKDKKIGDFKASNGLLNIYDKKGKKLKTIEYINGIEQKSE